MREIWRQFRGFFGAQQNEDLNIAGTCRSRSPKKCRNSKKYVVLTSLCRCTTIKFSGATWFRSCADSCTSFLCADFWAEFWFADICANLCADFPQIYLRIYGAQRIGVPGSRSNLQNWRHPNGHQNKGVPKQTGSKMSSFQSSKNLLLDTYPFWYPFGCLHKWHPNGYQSKRIPKCLVFFKIKILPFWNHPFW